MQELKERRVPKVKPPPELNSIRTKDPELRQKLTQRRILQRKSRKWMPPGYLWLIWRGREVRPPQYNSLEDNFLIALITGWRHFADVGTLMIFGLLCLVDLDDIVSTLLQMLAIFGLTFVLAAALNPFYYAWIRKKYRLSTWEELAA